MKGIREIISWPMDLPDVRAVKYSGVERLVGSSIRKALMDIMK